MESTVTAGNHAEQGYLVVRDAFSGAEVEPLLAEATEHAGWNAARIGMNRERHR